MKKNDFGYKVLYGIGFAIVVILGLLGNSFFAYEIVNLVFFDIMFIVLICILLLVRSIQVYLRQTTAYAKAFSLVYFNMFLIVFALRAFLTGRNWAIILLLSFVIAVSLLLVLTFKYIKAPDCYKITRFEPLIAVIPLFILLMLSVTQQYVDTSKMLIHISVLGTLISIIVLPLFWKFFRNIKYFKESKSEFIMSIILAVIVCYFFAWTTLATINYAFDDNQTITNFEIIDKRVSSGSRQMTSFYLKVIIDGKEKEIDVPVEIYHAKEIGQPLQLMFYSGALGYGYYIYEYTDN